MGGGLKDTLLLSLRRDRAILALSAIMFAVVVAIMTAKGIALNFASLLGNGQVMASSVLVLVVIDLLGSLAVARQESPIAFLRQRYLSPTTTRFVVSGLPVMIVLLAFLPFYSKMKSMIPLLNEYDWDPVFIMWDRWLLGQDAWRLMQPVLGYPIVTSAISACYQVWILLLYFGCLLMCYHPAAAPVRQRFFLVYLASWGVIGAGLATVFASVGPCFLEPLTGNAAFSDQMEYLRAANQQFPVFSLKVQDLLLAWFSRDERGLGSGITAMPSMHVAIAFLYVLACWNISRRLRLAMLAFALVILIGSVHLGYHYLVDGLVSIAVVAVLWRLSEIIVRKRPV